MIRRKSYPRITSLGSKIKSIHRLSEGLFEGGVVNDARLSFEKLLSHMIQPSSVRRKDDWKGMEGNSKIQKHALGLGDEIWLPSVTERPAEGKHLQSNHKRCFLVCC